MRIKMPIHNPAGDLDSENNYIYDLVLEVSINSDVKFNFWVDNGFRECIF